MIRRLFAVFILMGSWSTHALVIVHIHMTSLFIEYPCTAYYIPDDRLGKQYEYGPGIYMKAYKEDLDDGSAKICLKFYNECPDNEQTFTLKSHQEKRYVVQVPRYNGQMHVRLGYISDEDIYELIEEVEEL